MKKQGRGIFRLGTSNIVLPGPKATFPPEFQEGSRLRFYASLFNTVEVNSSFYKVPRAITFEKWAADVPNDFQFTIKLWRDITHAKRLDFKLADIDLFIQAAEGLGLKKGCLLIQFPASITVDYLPAIKVMLDQIKKHNGGSHPWRLAFEFRHGSWYAKSVYALLNKNSASIVLHDKPQSAIEEPPVKTDFIYLRFHGPNGDYRGSYSDDLLYQRAEQINSWLDKGKDVYAYFNNTMGSALENAWMLRDAVEGLLE